jgi:hypothetical protein
MFMDKNFFLETPSLKQAGYAKAFILPTGTIWFVSRMNIVPVLTSPVKASVTITPTPIKHVSIQAMILTLDSPTLSSRNCRFVKQMILTKHTQAMWDAMQVKTSE